MLSLWTNTERLFPRFIASLRNTQKPTRRPAVCWSLVTWTVTFLESTSTSLLQSERGHTTVQVKRSCSNSSKEKASRAFSSGQGETNTSHFVKPILSRSAAVAHRMACCSTAHSRATPLQPRLRFRMRCCALAPRFSARKDIHSIV
ncbi:uncharacterized protein COLE_02658 [Cutaneotrichosporon oleaginosum]|uniref:uncharacterized protein n=1 Tax=Cutaneotrichosporon oleaginosum TaxID=879819 RepID=UPI001328E754|nr:hypothetical protein COLE_02658 [Cutaneotrichosporon oleaginosum]